MTTYDDYLEDLKRVAEGEIEKHITPLKDKVEELRQRVESQYKQLIQEKNRIGQANRIEEIEGYKDLAQQFRDMKDYKDAPKLALECDNQYSTLKEKYKRQQENMEYRQRRNEAEIKAKIGVFLQIVITAVTFLLYYLIGMDLAVDVESQGWFIILLLILFLPVGIPAILIGIISKLYPSNNEKIPKGFIITIWLGASAFFTAIEGGGFSNIMLYSFIFFITSIPGGLITKLRGDWIAENPKVVLICVAVAMLAIAITIISYMGKTKSPSNETVTRKNEAVIKENETKQPDTFTDSRDSKTYKTIKIGKQTWMAENLNYNAKGSKCYDNAANCQKYGWLYDWKTAIKACPSGWHLPSDAEWQKLVDYAGGNNISGKKLKAESGWNKGGNGTNEYGFSALPGGNCDSKGNFGNAGNGGYWWSATESNATRAFYRGLGYDINEVRRNEILKSYLFSVNCVKD